MSFFILSSNAVGENCNSLFTVDIFSRPYTNILPFYPFICRSNSERTVVKVSLAGSKIPWAIVLQERKECAREGGGGILWQWLVVSRYQVYRSRSGENNPEMSWGNGGWCLRPEVVDLANSSELLRVPLRSQSAELNPFLLGGTPDRSSKVTFSNSIFAVRQCREDLRLGTLIHWGRFQPDYFLQTLYPFLVSVHFYFYVNQGSVKV